MEENSINMIVLKFVISVRGGHCDYLPRAPENLATPLVVNDCIIFYILKSIRFGNGGIYISHVMLNLQRLFPFTTRIDYFCFK
jgi:hypothetical protein